ncbi:MAG: alkaline phosphatase family protein [Porticoccaceae bacterium]|nr:alkaline phosphatase family protein [Porticoccaceae bacterium]MBT4164182.1 alkaline phosphatase family protein [Porticoccaceae bacterium]MBT5003341.1 alkaline phosphatase family protein [Porticoccaceae bacterium]MBT6028226.1 alkaline phosphatase family protein [Porticoccaceae bacterium]
MMIQHIRRQRCLTSILLIAVLSGCMGAAIVPTTTPKAIFIIVDGIPADVLENTYTPILDSIADKNGYTRAYTGGEIGGESQSPTSSAIGYNNLLTGTWANKHNVYDNQIGDPNYAYWDIFRMAKEHDPTLQTALFSTWTDNRTKLIGDGLEEAGGNKLDYTFDGFELDMERFPHDPLRNYIRVIDDLVTDGAAGYVESNGPALSWVYLEYTDSVGHGYGDGSEMTAAVQHMDGQIGKIWSAVQKRHQAYDEDWLIMVTTDHGRDDKTGQGHGNQSARERTIWIVTNSDDLNERYYQRPAIVDILPSITTHLKLKIPEHIRNQLDGHSFID